MRYRKDELDELDAAALSSPRKDELTDDMTLSMALWKAVADRLQLLLAVWDGGRVLEAERERLATLIHGRLDATLDPAVLAKGASAAGRRPGRSPCRCRRPAGCPTRWPASCASGSPSTPPPTRTPPGSRTCVPRSTGSATRSALEPDSSRARAQRTWDDLAVAHQGRHRATAARRRRRRPARPARERHRPVRARPDRRRRRAPRHPRPRRRGGRAPRGPARPLRRARAARGPLRRGGRPRAQVRRARRRGARTGAGLAARPRRLPRPSGAGRPTR